MGNAEQPTYQSRFRSKYSFNQLVNDPNFGPIKIYRKKQLNFDYVMVLQKYINSHQLPTLTKEISLIHKSFLSEDQPMVLRIFNYEVIEDKWSQCKLPMIRLYIQYFNFTLGDLIQRYREKSEGFSHDQIIYILCSVLDTYDFFQKINPTYFSINLQSIYLTPQGCIKFSPVKAGDFFQQSDAFCKAIVNTTQRKEIVNYERGKKALLSELKKLLSLFINMQSSYQLLKLRQKVEKVQKLEHLRKLLGKPVLDCISLTKSFGQTISDVESYHQSKAVTDSRVRRRQKKLILEKRK